MALKILVFQHVPWETPGLIQTAVEAAGGTVEILHPESHARAEAAFEEASGLVVMGGPMSANDDLEFLGNEMSFIRRAVEDGKAVLGVCLGAQLMAKALGGRVYPNPVKEIGWDTVELTESGEADRLFTGLGKIIPVLQWHGETFDLPPEAVLLASSPACRNQAFRFGKRAWGLQFHVEATGDMVRQWLGEPAMCGDLRWAKDPIDPARASAAVADGLFPRWVQVAREYRPAVV